MRRGFGNWLAAGLTAATVVTGAARAEPQSEVIYSHKAWEVLVIGYDDGSVVCSAQVSNGAQSFSIYADAHDLVRLQFYDESWEFGEEDYADLIVQIDRRAEWTLSDTYLHLQSALFDIGDAKAGARFIDEVMRGNVLRLSNSDHEPVESYSLAGSHAAIDALIDCVDVLEREGL